MKKIRLPHTFTPKGGLQGNVGCDLILATFIGGETQPVDLGQNFKESAEGESRE